MQPLMLTSDGDWLSREIESNAASVRHSLSLSHSLSHSISDTVLASWSGDDTRREGGGGERGCV